ncbi:helix-turn-helix domain-containing protein [Tumebacillus algifaecis]|uniref:helix-turn-helix domain-containing protein n=1 Tax=Tumebacillus algifaecis TaxID=1214604 RepID=UPI0015611C1B|nr:helix-turn-helix transcriptional regulator [Tumebacillus algifaecis]
MSLDLDIDARNRVIGENLRKYRLLNGLTQDELAEGICSVSQLSKAENGKTYIKRTLLRMMAERLGVTVERIETLDAMHEELSETLQLAKDATTANNLEKAFQYVREVLVQSEEMGYQSLYLEAFLTECKLLNLTRQHNEVIAKVHEVFDLGLPLDSAHKLLLMYELGHAYELSGNMVAAYDYYCRADEEFENVEGKDDVRLSVLFNLVRCHNIMQNYRAALRYAEKAEQLALEYSKHLYRLRISYMKATPLRKLGDYEKAEKIYLACLREAQENSFLLDVGLINNNIGNLYQEIGEPRKALAHYQRARKVYEILNEEAYLCETLVHLAEISRLEGDLENAVELCKQVLSITDKIQTNVYREKGQATRLIAWVLADQGKFDAHIAKLEEVLNIYDQHQLVREAYEVAVELADKLYEKNDPRAVDLYRKAVEFNKRSQQIGMRR